MGTENLEERRKRLRKERYIEKLKRRKRIRKTIFIAFIATALIAGGISLASFLSTNVYQNEDEFKEYADGKLTSIQMFNVKEARKTSYEYGKPISYAVDYDVCENTVVAAFRDEKIRSIEENFVEADSLTDTEKKDNKRKRDKNRARALIISSETYEADDGAINLAIFESNNVEEKKDMKEVSAVVSTYQFSKQTGSTLVPQQVFVDGYREICAQYFSEYFEKNYKDELSDDWRKYVTAEENNFNKYMINDGGVTFFFDEGTILKKSAGVVTAGMSTAEMSLTGANILRPHIQERYIDPSRPMVAVTYDDGPGGKSEARILKCLSDNACVATFFYLGSRVDANADNVKTARGIGCEIGNHTWNHPNLTGLSIGQVKKQIRDTNAAIKKVCGADPTVFRPSYGATNKAINSASEMPVILWTVDTLDWKSRNAKKIFKAVKGTKNLDGKIILMHSIYDSTADATELIVPWLKKHGYQLVTVSELIKYRTEESPKAGKVYREF